MLLLLLEYFNISKKKAKIYRIILGETRKTRKHEPGKNVRDSNQNNQFHNVQIHHSCGREAKCIKWKFYRHGKFLYTEREREKVKRLTFVHVRTEVDKGLTMELD